MSGDGGIKLKDDSEGNQQTSKVDEQRPMRNPRAFSKVLYAKATTVFLTSWAPPTEGCTILCLFTLLEKKGARKWNFVCRLVKMIKTMTERNTEREKNHLRGWGFQQRRHLVLVLYLPSVFGFSLSLLFISYKIIDEGIYQTMTASVVEERRSKGVGARASIIKEGPSKFLVWFWASQNQLRATSFSLKIKK